ncbi:hypothetical protein JTB14_016987 [Gonioctena quinquepunctata]|nr:hypothetical protein JTB14_016987 [Gonioctena quinquepunctata]
MISDLEYLPCTILTKTSAALFISLAVIKLLTVRISTKRSTHTVTQKGVMYNDDLITMSNNGCVSVSSVETRHFMESTSSPDSSKTLCSLMGQSAEGNLIQVGPDAHK